MKQSAAQILREYGPFAGVDKVHGVTWDGQHVWFATGDKLNALDPASGKTLRSIDVAAHAGTAFDGQHLFQIAEDRIQKIDPQTGRVLATIPAPGGRDPGLTWAGGWSVEGPRPALAQGLPKGMAAVRRTPGVIDTDMLRTCFGRDAGSYPGPDRWADRAIPFLLSLSAKHNGQSITVPG